MNNNTNASTYILLNEIILGFTVSKGNLIIGILTPLKNIT